MVFSNPENWSFASIISFSWTFHFNSALRRIRIINVWACSNILEVLVYDIQISYSNGVFKVIFLGFAQQLSRSRRPPSFAPLLLSLRINFDVAIWCSAVRTLRSVAHWFAALNICRFGFVFFFLFMDFLDCWEILAMAVFFVAWLDFSDSCTEIGLWIYLFWISFVCLFKVFFGDLRWTFFGGIVVTCI